MGGRPKLCVWFVFTFFLQKFSDSICFGLGFQTALELNNFGFIRWFLKILIMFALGIKPIWRALFQLGWNHQLIWGRDVSPIPVPLPKILSIYRNMSPSWWWLEEVPIPRYQPLGGCPILGDSLYGDGSNTGEAEERPPWFWGEKNTPVN